MPAADSHETCLGDPSQVATGIELCDIDPCSCNLQDWIPWEALLSR